MDDLHSLNESINQKAGRKLLPSIVVSLSILGVVFGALKINTNIFMAFVWIAMLLANREIVRAYSRGGIQIPLSILLIANTGLLTAAWWGKISGLAVATAFAIPNVMVSVLIISPKDFVKRSTAAVFAIFYIPFLAGFILLLAKDSNPIGKIFTLVVLVSCNDTFAYISGLLFGKHPLAPHISPKKTWEGLIGALVATTIGASLVFYFVLNDSWWLGAISLEALQEVVPTITAISRPKP